MRCIFEIWNFSFLQKRAGNSYNVTLNFTMDQI